jgi:putative phosphoribosyl transferase
LANQLTIRELRINLQLDEVTLEGHLAVPEDPHGIVIFAHGSGSSRHSPRNRFVARRLNESHLATLLFDLLTEEEHALDQATGHLRFDIRLLGRRLVGAVDSVARRPETAGMNIGLFGASTGAAAALVAAAERTNEISAVVSRGGRPDLAWESLRQVMAPTLLIVGEIDPVVIDLNQRAYEQLKREKRIDIVNGATHLFEEPGALEAVADLATHWFARHLKEREVTLLRRDDSLIARNRRKNVELPNKREMIQAIIDEEQEPWIIMKPSRQDPTDPEPLCIFENPAEHTQAKAEIPLSWFQNRELEKIKETIQQSLRHAQVQYKTQRADVNLKP